MSIVATSSSLIITLPTWMWACLAMLLTLGIVAMIPRRGRF